MRLIEHLDESRIIGDLIAREKYRFADKDVVAEAVRDTMRIVRETYREEIEINNGA